MRQYVINGESLVKVKFGAHVSGAPFTTVLRVNPNTTVVSAPSLASILTSYNAQDPQKQGAVVQDVAIELGLDTQVVLNGLQNVSALQDFITNIPGAYEALLQVLNNVQFTTTVVPGTAVTTNLCELGLSTDQIVVTPTLYHQDIHVDDVGQYVPAETLAMMAECTIRIDFIHYDPTVMEMCAIEAGGGAAAPAISGFALYPPNAPIAGLPFVQGMISPTVSGTPIGVQYGDGFIMAGTYGPAGRPMGNGLPLMASGNHYVSLSITSPKFGLPYRFRASYLSNKTEIPLGTEASIVRTYWRAIPYTPLYYFGANGALTPYEQVSASGSSWTVGVNTPEVSTAPPPANQGFWPGRVYDHEQDV